MFLCSQWLLRTLYSEWIFLKLRIFDRLLRVNRAGNSSSPSWCLLILASLSGVPSELNWIFLLCNKLYRVDTQSGHIRSRINGLCISYILGRYMLSNVTCLGLASYLPRWFAGNLWATGRIQERGKSKWHPEFQRAVNGIDSISYTTFGIPSDLCVDTHQRLYPHNSIPRILRIPTGHYPGGHGAFDANGRHLMARTCYGISATNRTRIAQTILCIFFYHSRGSFFKTFTGFILKVG